MTMLTDEGRAALDALAARHGISQDAALHMLIAVSNGGGTMAQFSHPELGGMGQWSMGGMIMVGDMFNNGLKARVDAICNDLSALLRGPSPFARPAGGAPGSGGPRRWTSASRPPPVRRTACATPISRPLAASRSMRAAR